MKEIDFFFCICLLKSCLLESFVVNSMRNILQGLRKYYTHATMKFHS